MMHQKMQRNKEERKNTNNKYGLMLIVMKNKR